jgi:adenylate cyclase
VYGDGVNVAARLEGLAEPGSVLISDKILREVEGKLEATFEDRGEQSVKNLMRPIRVYALRTATDKSASTDAHSAEGNETLQLPDKPSIAVLPFTNMSGDAEQEYFADGMAEDIITALSRFKSLFVIARNSSFTYKGRAVDVRQVGRELGVRYVLEGSVRKSAGRVRITGQLIEADTNSHLWADKIDGSLEDVFDLQDKVAVSVVTAIAPQVHLAEIERAKRKNTEDLNAYDYYLRGLAFLYQGPSSKTNVAEARRLWSLAVTIAPGFALAWAQLAALCNRILINRLYDDREAIRAEGVRLARHAISLDKNDPEVLVRVGITLGLCGWHFVEGAAFVEQGIAQNPNLAIGWAASGALNGWLGQHQLAIERAMHALRLSPRDQQRQLMLSTIALSLFYLGQYDEAISHAEEVLREEPRHIGMRLLLLTSHGLLGNVAESADGVRQYLSIFPEARITYLIETTPYRKAEDIARLEKALRLAGLPE